MEERAEPRFKTDSATVVEVVRDQAYKFSGRITDVSALGFQLELAQPLMVGETIRLTVDGYHLFAQVRRSEPSGELFEIGVERIDQWAASGSGQAIEAPPVAVTQPALGRPVLPNPLGSLRSLALRELFPGSDPKEAGTPAEASPSKEADQSKVAPQPRGQRGLKYQNALIAAGCITLAGWAGGSMAWKSYTHKRPAAVATAEASTPATEPSQAKASTRDTAPAAGASNATEQKPTESASAAATSSPSNTNSPAAIPAKTTPQTAAPVNTAAVSVVPAKPSANTVSATPAPKVQTAVSSGTAATPVAGMANRISLKATDVSWVTACVDGKNLFSKLFKKGDAAEVPFSRLAVVRSGNAGALELATNKESIGTLGTWGAIRTIKVTSAGHEFVAPALASNCSGE